MAHMAKVAKKARPMRSWYLPSNLWEEILLKLNARSEATCKMLCSWFNNLVKQPHYISMREKMVDEKEYCPVILPVGLPEDIGGKDDIDVIVRDNPLGWDLVEKRWCKLPSLNFLVPSMGMKLHSNECHNGLLFLTYCAKNDLGLECMYHYVCNPLTQSYISIDLSTLERRPNKLVDCSYSILINAEENGSGFTLFAATAPYTAFEMKSVLKLESTNLAGGWRPLQAPPANLTRGVQVIAGPVLLDLVIYSLCLMSNQWGYRMTIWLVSCNVATGEWMKTPVKTMKTDSYVSSSLLIVAGQMWWSQIVATPAPGNRFPNWKELSCDVSRYEPDAHAFITITTVPLGPDDTLSPRRPQGPRRGNYKSAICWRTSEKTLRILDVLTGKWSECPKPQLDTLWKGGHDKQILQGCLQMKHARLT